MGVGESQYNVSKYVDNNVGFTAKLLQSFVSNKGHLPKVFMLAGSMGPYGEGPLPMRGAWRFIRPETGSKFRDAPCVGAR